MAEEIIKVSTGVKVLDEILTGGIPEYSCVLVSGSCGTGKTILTQQFLFDGARKGEKGLYLSLTEPKSMMIRNLQPFAFFDKKLVDSGMVEIKDLNEDQRMQNLEGTEYRVILTVLEEILKDSKPKRLVIDSITALADNLRNKDDLRKILFKLRYILNNMEITTLLISEIPPMKFEYSKYGSEEFISDGVIILMEYDRKGELIRTLQVVKMRSVNHSRNKYVLKIMDDGINLIPLMKADL
ncbi:MAG: ATPase domain-containing protein [Candidatus Altiarchaeota archaeon]